MPANELLLNRLREALEDVPNVAEKAMFNGVTMMVDDKMCICVSNNELLCRIGPDGYEAAVELPGVRAMMSGKREFRGYVYVDETVVRSDAGLRHWVDRCLAFNPLAERSKKKKAAAQKPRP